MYFYEEVTNSSGNFFPDSLITYYNFYVHLKMIEFFPENFDIWKLGVLPIIVDLKILQGNFC